MGTVIYLQIANIGNSFTSSLMLYACARLFGEAGRNGIPIELLSHSVHDSLLQSKIFYNIVIICGSKRNIVASSWKYAHLCTENKSNYGKCQHGRKRELTAEEWFGSLLWHSAVINAIDLQKKQRIFVRFIANGNLFAGVAQNVNVAKKICAILYAFARDVIIYLLPRNWDDIWFWFSFLYELRLALLSHSCIYV